MFKKFLILFFVFLTIPCYSGVLPNVEGSVRLEETEVVFTVERLLFSAPFYITAYKISYEKDEDVTNVYVSFFFSIFKTKKRIDSTNEKTGKTEVRIPRTKELQAEKLRFFYRDANGIREMRIEE